MTDTDLFSPHKTKANNSPFLHRSSGVISLRRRGKRRKIAFLGENCPPAALLLLLDQLTFFYPCGCNAAPTTVLAEHVADKLSPRAIMSFPTKKRVDLILTKIHTAFFSSGLFLWGKWLSAQKNLGCLTLHEKGGGLLWQTIATNSLLSLATISPQNHRESKLCPTDREGCIIGCRNRGCWLGAEGGFCLSGKNRGRRQK